MEKVQFKKNDLITYDEALTILGSINPEYVELYKRCKRREDFHPHRHLAYGFINSSLSSDMFKDNPWRRINHEVEMLFFSGREYTAKIETFEERIKRRLDYEENILNSQRVKDFNIEALRIADKAKKKIDKRLQEFNEELLNSNAS